MLASQPRKGPKCNPGTLQKAPPSGELFLCIRLVVCQTAKKAPLCKGSCRRTPTEGLTASRRTQAVLPHPTIENQLNHSLGFAIPPAWRCHAVPPFAQGGLFFALLFPLIWQRRHAATRGGCGEPPHPSSAAAPDHAAKLNHSPSFTIPPDRLRRSVPPLHKGGCGERRLAKLSLPCDTALGQDFTQAPSGGAGAPGPKNA